MGKELAVFDLDGTLIRGNSMKLFALWLAQRLATRRRLREAACCVGWVMVRKLRLTSHREMKWRLLRLASRCLDAADYDRFVEMRLMPRLRPSVLSLLRSCPSQGLTPVLATAAPEVYASILGQKLKFTHTAATPFAPDLPLEDFTECRGEVKLAVIKKLGTPRLAATDHADDLPLLLACHRAGGTNYLVCPSPLTLMTVGAAGIPFLPLD